DKHNSTHREFADTIRAIGKNAKVRVFTNLIPNSSSVPAASKKQISLIEYRRDLPISQAYMALAGEMVPMLGKKRPGRPSVPDVEEWGRNVEEIEKIRVVEVGERKMLCPRQRQIEQAKGGGKIHCPAALSP